MKIISTALFVVVITILACGVIAEEDYLPSRELSSIEAGPVYYCTEETALISEVTATIMDSNGEALPDVHVALSTGSDIVMFHEQELLTDSQGKAVFTVVSRHAEEAVISALASNSKPVVMGEAVKLEAKAHLVFDVSLRLEEMEDPRYSPGKGLFSFLLSLTDDVGAVEGAIIEYRTEVSDVVVDPVEIITDTSGQAEVDIAATTSGFFDLEFILQGLETPLVVEAPLLGPPVSGEIIEAMSFPEIHNPRVGVMGVRVSESEPRILGELKDSVAVDLSVENPEFVLHLPFQPPVEWLKEIDGGVLLGHFRLALYNDDNRNGRWDEEEYIIASSGALGNLVFVMPDGSEEHEREGWQFLEDIEQEAEFLPRKPTASSQTLRITTAPVREPELTGYLDYSTNEQMRVRFSAVDAAAVILAVEEGRDFWSLLVDEEHSFPLLDEPVEDGSFSGYATDPVDVLDSDTLQSWSMTQEMGPSFDIEQLLILPVLYEDTEEYEGLEKKEQIAGSLRPPYGAQWHISYILDYPSIFGLFSPDKLWMHAGWNWWGVPVEHGIERVIENLPGFPTLQLDGEVPIDLAGISFDVRAPDAGDNEPPKANGRFASGGEPSLVDITACTGCARIAEGDVLRVTQVYSGAVFVDWSEPLTVGLY